MATIIATLNKKTAFAGGANVIRCKPIASNKNGVQIQAPGVILEDCVLKVRFPNSSVWEEVEVEEGAGMCTLVGKDFFVAEVELSGVPAGSWEFTFRQ